MKRDSRLWLQLMLIAFVANGLGPFGLKILDEHHLANFQPQYLVYWYVGGAIFGALAFFRESRQVRGREVAIGAVMGLCSLGGQSFTGLALAAGLPGHVVFPLTTGGSLFLVALAGIVLFRERVGRFGIAGISLGIISLIILSAA